MDALGKFSHQLLAEIAKEPIAANRGFFATRKLLALGFATWTPHPIADRLTITPEGLRALADRKEGDA